MNNTRALLTVAAMCAITSGPLLANSTATQPGSWGVNVHNPYHEPAIGKLGAQWLRLGIRWEQVEYDGPGRYNWAVTDKLLNYHIGKGYHIVCIFLLEKSNPVYASSASDRQAITQAIARWMGATALRYKGKGIVWELGNEPEVFPMGDYWNHPATYAQMARLGAAAIRQSDSSAKVAALALAWMDRTFVSVALNNGLLADGNIDYLSFHGYHRSTIEPESGLEDDINWLRAQGVAATPAGKNAPQVIDSETGYSIMPFGAPKAMSDWRVSVYTEEAQAAYLARHFLEEIYLGVPISIWYKDMNGEQQYSLYYADEKDSRGLRPMGHIYDSLAHLLPDNPAALKNDRYTVSIAPSSTKDSSAKLHMRSYLRHSTTGPQTLVIAVWNAIEAFDGKILVSRAFSNTEVLETWRNITPQDAVDVTSTVQIAGLTGDLIQSAQLLTYENGVQQQKTIQLTTNKNAPGASLQVAAGPTPSIVVVTVMGGPTPPSQLHVSP